MKKEERKKRSSKVKCDNCDARFETHQALEKHKANAEQSKQRCKLCSFVSCTYKSIQPHIRFQHGNHISKLIGKDGEDIKLEKENVENEANNVKSEMNADDFNCEFCEESFDDIENVDEHIKTCHPDLLGAYQCFYCDEKFNLSSILNKHMQDLHSQEDGIEDNDEDNESEPKSQPNSNSEEKPLDLRCEYCEQEFTSQEDLQNHTIKDHETNVSEQKTLRCIICKSIYENLNDLKKHVDEVHLNPTTSKFCQRCNTIFQSAEDLKEHASSCSKVRRKMWKKRSNSRPKRVKKGKKTIEKLKFSISQHKCNLCSKVFNGEEFLQKHVEISHKGVQCEHCNKSFYKFDYLRLHLDRAHKGVSEDLSKENAHQESTKFKCKVCSESFTGNDNLSDHILKVHAIELAKFKCELCNKSFHSSHNLDLHKRKTHKKLEVSSKEGKVDKAKENAVVSSKIKKRGRKKTRNVKSKHNSTEVKIEEELPKSDVDVVDIEANKDNEQTKTKDLDSKTNLTKKITCDRCDVTFNSHVRNNHFKLKNVPVKHCHICKSFKSCTGNGMNFHYRKLHPGKVYVPRFQEPSTSEKATILKTQKPIEQGETKAKPYKKCSICDLIFPDAVPLSRHLKNIHKINIEPVKEKEIEKPKEIIIETSQESSETTNNNAKLEIEKTNRSQQEDKPFTCHECEFIHTDREEFVDHVEKNHKKGKFPCNLCVFLGGNLVALFKHQLIKHSILLKCQKCKQDFKRSSDFESHSKLSCLKCSFKSCTDVELELHLKDKHSFPGKVLNNLKSLEIKVIEKESKTDEVSVLNENESNNESGNESPIEVSLTESMEQEVSKDNLEGSSKDSKIQSQEPETQNEISDKFTCGICEKDFGSDKLLQEHVNDCVKEPSLKLNNEYKCDRCDQSFTRKANMISHKKIKTNNVKICDECPFRSCNKTGMTRHVQMFHSDRTLDAIETNTEENDIDEKPQETLEIDVCPGEDKEAANDQPVDKIVEEKRTFQHKFKCDSCDMTFLTLSEKKDHGKLMTKNGNFCEICSFKSCTISGMVSL